MNSARRKLPWYIWVPLTVVLGASVVDYFSAWAGLASPEAVTFSGPTMGTRYAVTLAPTSPAEPWPPDVVLLQQRVDQRLAEINRLMSTYETESELSRFNRHKSDDWFPVSPETAEIVAAALDVAERSAGAFDPTVGPVVNLWGFGPQKGRVEPPSDAQIAEALKNVGYKHVAVRLDPPALRKSLPGVYLDLSGIAKGHAADAVSELLDELGFTNSMVAIGGEIRVRGRNAQGDPWRVGVDGGQGAVLARVVLVDSAISTSGDFHNFFDYRGKRYSHTIDPATGRPVRHDTAAVSVVASTAMEADALATAALVMGYPRGYEWCDEQQIAALFLVRHGGRIVTCATQSFEAIAK